MLCGCSLKAVWAIGWKPRIKVYLASRRFQKSDTTSWLHGCRFRLLPKSENTKHSRCTVHSEGSLSIEKHRDSLNLGSISAAFSSLVYSRTAAGNRAYSKPKLLKAGSGCYYKTRPCRNRSPCTRRFVCTYFLFKPVWSCAIKPV